MEAANTRLPLTLHLLTTEVEVKATVVMVETMAAETAAMEEETMATEGTTVVETMAVETTGAVVMANSNARAACFTPILSAAP